MLSHRNSNHSDESDADRHHKRSSSPSESASHDDDEKQQQPLSKTSSRGDHHHHHHHRQHHLYYPNTNNNNNNKKSSRNNNRNHHQDHSTTTQMNSLTTNNENDDDSENVITNHQSLALQDEFYVRLYIGGRSTSPLSHRHRHHHHHHHPYECMQFTFHSNGLFKYMNRTAADGQHYQHTNNGRDARESDNNDGTIWKQVHVSQSVMNHVKSIVESSCILLPLPSSSSSSHDRHHHHHGAGMDFIDDEDWPQPDYHGTDGIQELEIVMNNVHVSLVTKKIRMSSEIQRSRDPHGLSVFYFLCQDLKAFGVSLIRMYSRSNPLQ